MTSQLIDGEKRLRTRLSIYAYAYEMQFNSLISDIEYDRLAKLVNLSIKTGNPKYDEFFEQHYVDYSGMWVRQHPDAYNGKLQALYKYITSLHTLYT